VVGAGLFALDRTCEETDGWSSGCTPA